MDCSTPGVPVPQYLPEFAQVHAHCIGGDIQPSHPLNALFSFCPQSFPASGTFPVSQLFASDDQNTGTSALASVLPVDLGLISNQSLLRLTGLISLLSKGFSAVFSITTVQGINSLAFCLLYGPALTTVHDHWEHHSLDYTDLCWQSNVSAFQYIV